MAQTVGSLIGILIYKLKFIKVKEHRILVGGTIGVSLAIILFAEIGTYIGGWISIIIYGCCSYCSMTTVNICLVNISVNNPGYIPFAHGIYGVGALLSPQIIRFL